MRPGGKSLSSFAAAVAVALLVLAVNWFAGDDGARPAATDQTSHSAGAEPNESVAPEPDSEGILPDEPDGHYAEFAVETPGLDHRGARRIVTGEGGELYRTDDHHGSFSRIAR